VSAISRAISIGRAERAFDMPSTIVLPFLLPFLHQTSTSQCLKLETLTALEMTYLVVHEEELRLLHE
jgi:hypothetical protein